MSSHYPDEWAERMHSALGATERHLEGLKNIEDIAAATERHLEGLKNIEDIAAALYGAASDIRKEEDLRTVVKSLAKELIGSNFAIECMRKELEYGLQLPEAEQEQTGERCLK